MPETADMGRDDENGPDDLPAGSFSSWVTEMRGALRGERDADVPCGACTACCTSSQFIQIGPDETETLRRIPGALLFPAPLLPRGHVVMGYDERGNCPMLVENRCSIYEHRPRTCRTYDCRVFPAAGLEIDGADKALIARQTRRWQFSHATPDDHARNDAVRMTAGYLRDHADELPDGAVPGTTTQLAVLAFELHELFLRHDGEAGTIAVEASLETVGNELVRRRNRRAQ